MLVISKMSKAENINPSMFGFISVSETLKPSEGNTAKVVPMIGLLPPSELRSKLKAGEMKDKKFLKEYKKYLETDAAMIELFNIGLAIEKGERGLCFICSDDEWEIGYMQVLAEKIEDLYGVKFVKYKDVKKKVDKVFDGLSKKEKKNEKKVKKTMKKAFKELKKEYLQMSFDGEETLQALRDKYAVDYIFTSAIFHGLCKIDGEELKIDKDAIEKNMKKSAFLKAIHAASKSNKKYGKIVAKVLAAHDLKEKKLEKLNKESLLHLVSEIVEALQAHRYGKQEA